MGGFVLRANPPDPRTRGVTCYRAAMTKSRPWLAGLIGGSLLASCQADRPEEANNTASPPAPKVPALPVPEPLDREALLFAAARAASAAALGEDDRQAQRALDGDPFELRIRFGCPAGTPPQPADPAFDVRYDAADRTLRLRLTPTFTGDQALVSTVSGEEVEAVEGFWIARPWILKAGCPSRIESAAAEEAPAEPASEAEEAKEAAAPAPPAPKLAIAQFFTAADPRTGRRDRRAYETTKVMEAGQQPSRQGYDFVLSGRLKPLNGRVISCAAGGGGERPECVISTQFDRVWIERADTGAMLAEWGRS